MQKGMCTGCGERRYLQRHHILPRAARGSDDPENIQMLCYDCHYDKHNGLVFKWGVPWLDNQPTPTRKEWVDGLVEHWGLSEADVAYLREGA